MGETMVASWALGIHPVSMKRAVRKPHAMKAPMFGMTIPDRNLPNFDTPSRAFAIPLSFPFLLSLTPVPPGAWGTLVPWAAPESLCARVVPSLAIELLYKSQYC